MTEPYYQDDHVTLYHGDCREVLAGMPDESVAAVLTDPPYTERTHSRARSTSNPSGIVEFESRPDVRCDFIQLRRQFFRIFFQCRH